MWRFDWISFFKTALLPVCLAVFGTVRVDAQATPSAQTQPQPLVQQFQRKHGSGWSVRLSADKQRIESVVGLGTRTYGEKPEPAARAFLSENAQMFGLRPDLGDMRVLAQRSSTAGGHVEFQQVINGLPVENGRVQVNLSRDGRILQVVNHYAPYTPQGPATPELSKEQATESAITEFLRTTPEKPPDMRQKGPVRITPLPRSELQLKRPVAVEDVYFATAERLVRAYKITVVATRPLGYKEFIVDAASGAILQVKDRDQYFDNVTGTGQVFIPNPVASLNNNAITHTTVPNTNPNPYFTVQLLDLNDPAAGPFVLNGPFAQVQDIESPSNTPVSVTGSANFVFQSNSDNFGDMMVYYHIDRIQRYIQELGFIDANNRTVAVDSRGLSDVCNAHYDPSPVGAGHIAFGLCNGSERVAEDAEVIGHEYGHSIQDNQTLGKYPPSGMPGSMGEGFGDYWGISNYAAELTAAGHDLACIGDWIRDGSCSRRLDTGKTMDDYDAAGDIHTNGEIWSQALFNLFNNLGKTTTDRLVLQSHFNVPDGVTFKQAGDALLTADLQLFFGTHITQICNELLARKIYVAGDCPTLPSATGAQSTLVVLARFNDLGLPNSPMTAAQVGTLVNNMSAYLSTVSFTQATLGPPAIHGWLDLGNSRTHYYDATTGNMLVDLAQDVINSIHSTDPTFDFNAVDRIFIITNDDGSGGETRGQQEWATTGPWPYAIPSGVTGKRFSASVHTFNQTAAQFDHALGHHFGMFDLYPHDGVTFPRSYADGWSNMAKDPTGNFNNVEFLGWDKLKPGWVNAANVNFIPRQPSPPAPAFDQIIKIFREETNNNSPTIIQVGTTNGVTQRSQERVSYYIEARKKAGTYDVNLPSDAVLVYYVNEDIGQGFGPLRLVDATPGTPNDLTDAGFLPAPAVSSVTNIDGTGLNVEVLPATGTEDYRVHITYSPPATQVDVWIHPQDGNWQSQDIWVDSPACNNGVCGFDKDNGRPETDHGDLPKPGVVNRLYARVYNHGPGTAHNVRVDFYLSEPYHGLDGGNVDPDTGGNVAFNEHYFTVIADLPQTDAGVPVYVEWTPLTPPSGDVHTCVKVKIAAVFNDTNPSDQTSQENLTSYDLTSHSPYPPVVDDFKVANPYDHPILVYLRADDVPVGWTADIVPKKVYLPVGGSITAQMTVHAPLTYPVCSTEFVKATGWYAAGDTLVPFGASVAQVNLKKSTDLTVNTTVGSCKRGQTGEFAAASSVTTTGACQELTTQGCTNPPRPFEHITLTYTGPDGKPIYHDVITDKNGCYEDFLVNPQGGVWSVETQYPGNSCNARTNGRPQTVVVLPGGGIPGGGNVPPGVRERLWYSLDLGVNFPVGSFAKNFDPGPSITADLEYQFKDRVSVEMMYGFHFFHSHSGTSAPAGFPVGTNLYYRNLSFNARVYFPFSWARLYVQAGPGAYFPNFGSTVGGVNAGVGFSFHVLTNLKFEVGSDIHFVDPGGTPQNFIDHKLGIAFRF